MALDEPPFTCRTWFERARSSYAISTDFDTASATGPLLDRLFFGVRTTGEGVIGVYVELYHDAASRRFTACSLAYVAPEDSVLDEMKTKVDHLILADSMPQGFDFTSPTVLGGAYWFRVLVQLQGHSGSKLSVAAEARLHKNYSATFVIDNLKILPATFPDRDRNLRVFGRLVEGGQLFCPNCFGRGSFKSMAIPKADWESGASGYALYSCNLVNGRVACVVCGGSGGDYLPWYLDEHPELRSVVLAPGSGLKLQSEA